MESYSKKNHDYRIKKQMQMKITIAMVAVIILSLFCIYTKYLAEKQYKERIKEYNQEGHEIETLNDKVAASNYRRGYTKIKTELSE